MMYDEKMGARPLARLIQETIKKPLAEDLLFGKLIKGGLVKVCIKNEKIHLDISSPDKPRLSSNKPPLLTATVGILFFRFSLISKNFIYK